VKDRLHRPLHQNQVCNLNFGVETRLPDHFHLGRQTSVLYPASDDSAEPSGISLDTVKAHSAVSQSKTFPFPFILIS